MSDFVTPPKMFSLWVMGPGTAPAILAYVRKVPDQPKTAPGYDDYINNTGGSTPPWEWVPYYDKTVSDDGLGDGGFVTTFAFNSWAPITGPGTLYPFPAMTLDEVVGLYWYRSATCSIGVSLANVPSSAGSSQSFSGSVSNIPYGVLAVNGTNPKRTFGLLAQRTDPTDTPTLFERLGGDGFAGIFPPVDTLGIQVTDHGVTIYEPGGALPVDVTPGQDQQTVTSADITYGAGAAQNDAWTVGYEGGGHPDPSNPGHTLNPLPVYYTPPVRWSYGLMLFPPAAPIYIDPSDPDPDHPTKFLIPAVLVTDTGGAVNPANPNTFATLNAFGNFLMGPSLNPQPVTTLTTDNSLPDPDTGGPSLIANDAWVPSQVFMTLNGKAAPLYMRPVDTGDDGGGGGDDGGLPSISGHVDFITSTKGLT